MESPYNKKWSRDSAVCLLVLEIPHFTLVEEPKVFKNNLWNIHPASQKLCIFPVLKIIYISIYTMFLP